MFGYENEDAKYCNIFQIHFQFYILCRYLFLKVYLRKLVICFICLLRTFLCFQQYIFLQFNKAWLLIQGRYLLSGL